MLTIEKIEGTIVTVEDDNGSFDADISLFDGKIREGDILTRLPDGHFIKYEKATEKRRKDILKLQNSLWN